MLRLPSQIKFQDGGLADVGNLSDFLQFFDAPIQSLEQE